MNSIKIIAIREFKTVFHNKIFITIALLFLAMSILSVYIGSSTKKAELKIYNETIANLTAQGSSEFPPKPEVHTLTILSNLREYISMIGAIMAIVLGFSVLTQEKESGGLKLILSRPVFRDQLLTGKLLGNSAVIGLILGLAFLFNLILLFLVGGIFPTFSEILRLIIFTLLAFFYMLIFLTFSMLLSIKMKNSSTVFLISILVWISVSFVIPQMAETMKANSTVINSISGLANQIPQDTTISRAINYLSPTWHFDNTGGQLLEVFPGSVNLGTAAIVSGSLLTLLILIFPSLIFMVIGYSIFLRNETLILK